jgi:hypothetical protein
MERGVGGEVEQGVGQGIMEKYLDKYNAGKFMYRSSIDAV